MPMEGENTASTLLHKIMMGFKDLSPLGKAINRLLRTIDKISSFVKNMYQYPKLSR